MHSSLPELFEDWHDFYLLVGTAAATLVGLMFVAIILICLFPAIAVWFPNWVMG